MQINTIAHAVPKRRISTEWVVKKLRAENASVLSAHELEEMENTVVAFLEGAGSDIKYQVDDDETALEVLRRAAEAALRNAEVDGGDIDLIVYASVARGWLEPAMANVVQAELGLERATCFDLLDGCAGWLRAVETVRSLLHSGAYRRALIVTCECGFAAFGRWQFRSVGELSRYLATYTIGEAATVTVLSAEPRDDDFTVRFANYGEFAKLCMIPLDNAAQFIAGPVDEGVVSGKFYAHSRELLGTTTRKIIELWQSEPRFHGAHYDLAVGHAASEKAAEIVRSALGIPREIYVPTHAEYGNTVSASVPLAISLAIEQGRLERGQRVLTVVGASGITVGLASFTY